MWGVPKEHRMADRIELGHVAHLTIAVRDPAATAAWWERSFNVEVNIRPSGRAFVDAGGVAIVFFAGEPQPAGLEHLAFAVADQAALFAAAEILRRNGVAVEDPAEPIGPVAPGSDRLGVWFRDPDGYRWELIAPSSKT
jgi:catechol 2,3-dioxygenase-like lactoylglutathione lyase family enzyme